jgi:hypothetical protein
MSETKLEFYAIIDLFGHQRIAGFVTEAEIGGCSFVRVDVPAVDGSQAISKFYGNGAIYSMTPVSKEVVELFVQRYKPAPLNVYMPEIRELPVKRDPMNPGYDPADDDPDGFGEF